MNKAIVTGATGFVASWLIRELVSRDVAVIAIVREPNAGITTLAANKLVRIVVCSIADYSKLPDLIDDRDVDVFYHFAWAGTSGAARADIRMQLANVQAVCDAIRAAADIGCRRFVNAGSIMAYETISYSLQDGAEPGLANIYSAAKLSADLMGKTLAVSLKLPYITAIISNIYGEGEKSARFINTTLRKLLRGERASFTHGNQMYDFIHAKDAAKAFLLIGEKGQPYISYYIGNPAPRPLKDFIKAMRDLVDKSIVLHFGEILFQGAALTYLEFDTAKLKKEFDFVPEISFEQGISDMIRWIRSGEGQQP
jgi:UDP-glucose 4-epimerase